MEYSTIALSLITIFILIYYYITKNYKFFKNHGIVHAPPLPLVGNMWPLISQRVSMHELITNIYNLHSEAKYVGMYELLTPIVVIRDPDLIKSITTKNFEQFPDHRTFINKDMDLMLSKMLLTLTGEEWKEQRSMLTPTFTSSKIKSMFKLMSECAQRFSEYMYKLPEKDREMDMKALLTMYTNDVIATCVYGDPVDTISDPKNVFYVYGRTSTSMVGFKKNMMMLINRNAPWLTKMLGLRFIDQHISKFFYDQVANTIQAREQGGTYRSDILQLFVDARNKKDGKKSLTVDQMAYHAFSFFFGGFDSVASQSCFVAHMLAEYPDVQQRLQEEIDEALEKNNGQLTYDAISEMKYLDAVINETMRLFPIATFLDRTCVKDFELPPPLPGGKPFVVRAGTNVWMSISGIQRDPKYYDNPDEFYPDRFIEDGKKIFNSGAFLPFGMGPRMCIGNRFALTEVKVLICNILTKCSFKVGRKTLVPLKLQEGLLNSTAKDGFWLRVEPRKQLSPFVHIDGTVNENG